MRKEYVAPKSAVVNFDIEDVITDVLPLNGGSQPGFEGGAGGSLGSNPFNKITGQEAGDEEDTEL